MSDLDLYPLKKAARWLGVSEQRARVLAAEGRLPAVKVGGRWVVRSSDLEHLDVRTPGRPLSACSAWAYLWLLSGKKPDWVSPSQLSRLRRCRPGGPEELATKTRTRSRTQSFWVHSSLLSELRADPRLVKSGMSALRRYSVDLLARDEAEAYVKASDQAALLSDYRAIDGQRSNLRLRVVEDGCWPFGARDSHAPQLVVALDLVESGHHRAARAGKELFSRALREDS